MYTFLLGILGLLAVGAGVRALIRHRREGRDIAEFARREGLNYTREDLIGVHDRYNRLELIRQGHSRTALHVMYGRRPVGLVTVFRYTYEVGLGADSSTPAWWMAVVETRQAYEHWRTAPVGEVDAGEWSVQRGGMRFRADRERTLVEAPGQVEAVLGSAGALHAEAWGQLVAVAGPAESVTPGQVLDVACKLADALTRE